MKSDIAEAVRLFAGVLRNDDGKAKATCFEAIMRCVRARGGAKYDEAGKEYVDLLVLEVVRDEVVDATRSALVAKLASRLEELGGREFAEAATKVVHEMFEWAEQDSRLLPPRSRITDGKV
jgi:hypothetical protein